MEDTKLQIALNKYYEDFPDDLNIKEWAGCNYSVNQGNSELEPNNTAQSMHDCLCCNLNESCTLKQVAPIWYWNESVEQDLLEKWKALKSISK